MDIENCWGVTWVAKCYMLLLKFHCGLGFWYVLYWNKSTALHIFLNGLDIAQHIH
jgi:hypothetical protein